MIKRLIKETNSNIEQGKWKDALGLLNEAIELEEGNTLLLEMRSDVYHKLNRLADAVNDLNSYLKLLPDDEKVTTKKELIQLILKNSQLDVYGCTNTHLDPWS